MYINNGKSVDKFGGNQPEKSSKYNQIDVPMFKFSNQLIRSAKLFTRKIPRFNTKISCSLKNISLSFVRPNRIYPHIRMVWKYRIIFSALLPDPEANIAIFIIYN